MKAGQHQRIGFFLNARQHRNSLLRSKTKYFPAKRNTSQQNEILPSKTKYYRQPTLTTHNSHPTTHIQQPTTHNPHLVRSP